MVNKGIQQEYLEIDRWAVRPAFAGFGVLCAGLLFAFCYGGAGNNTRAEVVHRFASANIYVF